MFDKIYSLEQIVKEPVVEPIWLVDRLIGIGDAVTVYGDWGSGKSYLLVYLALCLGSGMDFLGDMRVRQAKVLYLDKEMSFAIANYRINMLLNGNPTLMNNAVGYVSQPSHMINEQVGLELVKVMKNYDVLILDSLRSFLSGTENAAQDVRTLWNALLPLKRQGKTVILTHHMNKAGAFEQSLSNRASGSTDICAGSDTVLAIEKTKETQTSLTSRITQVKGRWDSKKPSFYVEASWESKAWSRYSIHMI